MGKAFMSNLFGHLTRFRQFLGRGLGRRYCRRGSWNPHHGMLRPSRSVEQACATQLTEDGLGHIADVM